MHHRFSLRVLTVLVAAVLPCVTFAAKPLATASGLEWHPPIDGASVVLSVQHPDGQVVTETFAGGRNPLLQLDGLADGVYSYELRFASQVESGSFTVANGMVVRPDLLENATLSRPPARPATNPFYTDDVSAQGGICAGFDCTSTESYGFATAKLKENNTRLKFEDTSSSAGFPTTDWQLSANDMSSGGAEKFFIEDLTAATVPLLIEGGTPTHSLYLDSTGRIGMRTSTPAKDLHIATGSSPTIRLEQTGASPRSWEMTANNANFFLRDVTGATNPVIIRSGAPSSSFVIDAAANIGLGISFPSFPIEHSSGARLDAGNWVNASSRDVKQDIHALDRDAAFEALQSLQPVTFAYRTNPGDPQVGFIAEEVPDLVATTDRKGLSSMDVVAVLTKVIQEQQKTIDEMRTRLDRLEQQ